MAELWQVLNGDALAMLQTLPDESVNCIVTSPPYYGLRDYGHEGQIGLEQTPQEFIKRLADVFRECRRVLTKDGTCWVNMGDSYAANGQRTNNNGEGASTMGWPGQQKQTLNKAAKMKLPAMRHELKPKDLMGIPWRLAFALQDDGWYLRQDIIWAKPNPMPESVRDRCTKAHEYIFMLTKSPKYWYDASSIKEPVADVSLKRSEYGWDCDRPSTKNASMGGDGIHVAKMGTRFVNPEGRNARSVWAITTEPYPGAHFAVFPTEIPKRCILAGCPEGGVVLDPFAGSGTTLAVAVSLGRRAIGLELNPEYVALIHERLRGTTPSLFGGEA